MENLIENLKKYFATTSPEKIMEEWDRTKDYDLIAPTMDEFLAFSNCQFKLKAPFPALGNQIKINIENYSPKFSSGFFFTKTKKNGTSSIFDNRLSV